MKPRICNQCGECDEAKFHPTRASECKICGKNRKLKWKREKRTANPVKAQCPRCGVVFRKMGNSRHCSDCVPKHKSEHATKKAVLWNATNTNRRRGIANRYARKQIETLGNNYVLSCMTQDGGNRNAIPLALVEAYKSNMKLKRTIKEIQK